MDATKPQKVVTGLMKFFGMTSRVMKADWGGCNAQERAEFAVAFQDDANLDPTDVQKYVDRANASAES